MTIVFWVLAAFWFLYTINRLRAAGAVPALILPNDRDRDRALPRVSVIIAARNEQERIERTVRGILGQTGIDLELWLVDDRSDDATPRILERLREEDPRLNVLRVDELPEDWLGKPHACHLAARRATGDWLLFSDADVWMCEDAIARAVSMATLGGADHFCMFPAEHRTTFMSRAGLVFLVTMFSTIPARVNRDRWFAFVGIGAFNLVRAEAYREIGGHEALRFEVIDDAKMGLLMKRAGFRTRVADSAGAIEVEWASDLLRLITALEKNMFAMFNYSLALAVTVFLCLAGAWTLGVVGPLTGGAAGWAAGAGLLSTALPGLILARRAGFGPVEALLSPLMMPVLLTAIAHSTFATLRQGGVRWRGTFYPLARLRREQVRW